MSIRIADPAEAPAVAALITSAYRVEDFFVDGDRANAQDVLNRMTKGEFLLLEDAGRALAGCVYVEIRGTQGYFGLLSVDPARQRRGLGAQLVAAAEEHCRRAGCSEMEIEVVNLREELPSFYRRLGYSERGTRQFRDAGRARRPCHFVVMTKRLSRSESNA
ncbi:MAG TPA: GNAT family N-acetyltransferase [Vicinamibacterales bacterium]|nr:GNAT family N-acetyltransferase [Vicinamibacterales bacterium]